MPAPRADYACATCARVYELPVAASACPQGHPVARLWTPPHVARGVAQHVDRLVEPQWEHARRLRAARSQFTTSPLAAPALLQALPGHAKAGSQAYSVPALERLSGALPRPMFVGKEPQG